MTKISTITCFIITFCGHHSIEASLSTIVGYVVVLEIGLLLGFWTTVTRLDLVALWNLSLTLKVNVLTD